MSKMKDLHEAEIFVDTVFSVESGAGGGTWFHVADYATMSELLTDCADWFSDEAHPEYVYTDWNGIPDSLIKRTWLCPNLFEIRNALGLLDRESIGPFVRWCRSHGHDLRTDDPLMLVTRYQDHVPTACEPSAPDVSEPPDDTPYIEPLHLLLGPGFGRVEIFDDNYD